METAILKCSGKGYSKNPRAGLMKIVFKYWIKFVTLEFHLKFQNEIFHVTILKIYWFLVLVVNNQDLGSSDLLSTLWNP